jgi:hypothetical protein
MRTFWESGHTVFGVDCADEAISDFFVGNGISYQTRPLTGGLKGQVHSSPDNRLNVLQHNFLTLDHELINGTIDVVWDRGAFGTITIFEQELYVKTMRRLLSSNFRYLLLVLEFDEDKFEGPPLSQPESKVRSFFSDFCNIEKLESRIPDHVGLYQKHMGNPLEVRETTYLMTPLTKHALGRQGA